jgi:hypothetical protein
MTAADYACANPPYGLALDRRGKMSDAFPISQLEAKVLAEKEINAIAAANDDDFAVVDHKTIEIAEGWVFFYNSREFIETGDSGSQLAGNGPIFVDRRGAVEILPTDVPWEWAIKNT